MRTAHVFGIALFLSLFTGRDALADVPPNCDDPATPGSEIQSDPAGDGGEAMDAGPDAGRIVPTPRGGSCPPSGSSNGSSCSMSRAGIDASIGGFMLVFGAVSLLAARRRRP